MDNQARLNKPSLTSLIAAASMLGLTACVQTDVDVPTQAETVMRNSVQMVRLPLEIRSEDDGTITPSGGTLARVNAFLASVDAGYGDVVMLDAGMVEDGRVDALADFIRSKGLAYGGEAALGAKPADGSMMLYVERYVVTVPNCGQWEEELTDDRRNNPSSFHGCSVTTSLGLMIANPRDLVAGQGRGNSTSAAVGALYTPGTAPAAALPGNMTISVDGMTMSAPMPALPSGSSSSGNSGSSNRQ